MAPKKTFICHASEDKARFVLAFAERLRAAGIDAWLDKWEILLGQSLVDRIFEEGIKHADAMIIVLSTHSVSKKWVREELNAGVVKRIEEGITVIPVVIDDCEIPESLKSLLRIHIRDLTSYDAEFADIVNAIHGLYNKPPLGSVPASASVAVDVLPGLAKVDGIILKAACDIAMETGTIHIDTADIEKRVALLELDAQTIHDSMEVLGEKGLLEPGRVLGPRIPHARVTIAGFDVYARSCVPDYASVTDEVIAALTGNDTVSNRTLAAALQRPVRLVDHVLDRLAGKGLVKFSTPLGGHRTVFYVSPTLKRLGQ